MNTIIKLFNPRLFLQIIMLICIEQLMVAGSTFALIKATQSLTGGDSSPIWFLTFIFLLFIPYIPGIYSREKLETLCLDGYHNYLTNRLTLLPNPNSLWAQRSRKNNYNLGLGAEGLSIIKQIAHTFFDLLTVILNITFNLFVIGITLDYKIGAAFMIGSIISIFLIKYLSNKTELSNSVAQNSKNKFFHFLSYAWDNILLQNKQHKSSYLNKFKNDFAIYKENSKKCILEQEKSSVITTYGLAIPVILTSIYIFLNSFDKNVASALLSSLPRQFQIIGNIQVLFSYYLLIFGLKSQANEILNLTSYEEFTPTQFIDFNQIYLNKTQISKDFNIWELNNGRYTIRGNNGSGKSMLLSYWKILNQEKIYLIPAHSDLWSEGIDHENLSSGERILLILENLLHNEVEKIILLDEWDANLDINNRLKIENILNQLSVNHIVIEVRHNNSD